ncbi:MAG: amino acid adenylation domain-containing protein [Planctomycetota bacterium]
MSGLLHDHLTLTAGRFPMRDAYRGGKHSIHYADLDDQSSRLASLLVKSGVRVGDCVGVRLPPGIESPIAVYGAMKAGAAMVPIDPLAPDERVKEIITQGSLSGLITHKLSSHLCEWIPSDESPIRTVVGTHVMDLPEDLLFPWESIPSQDCLPRIDQSERDIAYVIFTSGSTGTPKGIVHSHRSACSYARLSAQLYGVSERDCIANLSPLHFDMSTFGYFTSVLAGATTILVPPNHAMLPASLTKLIESEGVTIWYSVPFAILQMLQRGVLDQRDLHRLRWILYGGEPLSPEKISELRRLLPAAWISNVYGPAEVNQCTYFHIAPFGKGGPETLDCESVPIGSVWDETDALLVDASGSVIEAAGVGEFLIHSSTMMTRYWHSSTNDPKSFYFHAATGKRYYRTGDLVRRRDDGLYEFISRIDRQVKIRGYRIELDEIERILGAHPDVNEPAVYCVRRGGELVEKSIHAAVTLKRDSSPETESGFRQFLANRLSSYAVPESIEVRESFPRTTSGKIDRRALSENASCETTLRSH